MELLWWQPWLVCPIGKLNGLQVGSVSSHTIVDCGLRRLMYACFYESIGCVLHRPSSPFVHGVAYPTRLCLRSSGIVNLDSHAGTGWCLCGMVRESGSSIQIDHSHTLCGKILEE